MQGARTTHVLPTRIVYMLTLCSGPPSDSFEEKFMKKSARLDHSDIIQEICENNSINQALKCLSNLSRYFIIQWAFEAGREPFHSTLICIRSHD